MNQKRSWAEVLRLIKDDRRLAKLDKKAKKPKPARDYSDSPARRDDVDYF